MIQIGEVRDAPKAIHANRHPASQVLRFRLRESRRISMAVLRDR
jgi:hypothetical protein